MRDYIKHIFDDLPVWTDAGWQAGTIDGLAEIEFCGVDDWCIVEIAITADNGKTGDNASHKNIWLARLNPLWVILAQSMIATRKSQIEDDIAARIAKREKGDDIADLRHSERM